MSAEEEILNLEKEFGEAIVKKIRKALDDLLQMTGSSLTPMEELLTRPVSSAS